MKRIKRDFTASSKMTIEKVIYKCECGHKEDFDEDVYSLKSVFNTTVSIIKLKEYPPRICEKCGQEMGV